MARRLAFVVAGAFAASVLMAGAAQAVCDPHCSPKSNSGGEVRGLNRANEAAGVHGQQGRDNAAAKQGVVPTPAPVVLPPDADADGIPDAQDLCPNEKGLVPDGCPAPAPPPGA